MCPNYYSLNHDSSDGETFDCGSCGSNFTPEESHKAFEAFESANCRLVTLTDFSTLAELASETGYITEEDKAKIGEWLKDPSGWKPD